MEEQKVTVNYLPQKKRRFLPKGPDTTKKLDIERHVYLQAGDRVFHKRFKSWGTGTVVETMASEVPGGLCYVRIQFQDGKKRVFDNSLDSACCCYYAGVTLINRIEL